jgi:hypothetical protein
MMAPFGLPVRVHRNAFSLEMLACSQDAVQKRSRPANRVVIGYASGTRTHDRDFALIRPVLFDLMKRHPQVELWLIGDIEPGSAWGGLQERVKMLPRVPWRELPRTLASLDINLAPLLPESPFNQAKSEIKFMEAALVRVPTIASPTDAFLYGIRPGQNGFLAGTPEAWSTALEQLVGDVAAREDIGNAAYEDVLENYAPWVRSPEMLSTLVELAGQTGKAAFVLPSADLTFSVEEEMQKPFCFSPADEEHPSMQELARYSIRHRGIQTLLGQVWVYFRRKLAPIFPFRGTKQT